MCRLYLFCIVLCDGYRSFYGLHRSLRAQPVFAMWASLFRKSVDLSQHLLLRHRSLCFLSYFAMMLLFFSRIASFFRTAAHICYANIVYSLRPIVFCDTMSYFTHLLPFLDTTALGCSKCIVLIGNYRSLRWCIVLFANSSFLTIAARVCDETIVCFKLYATFCDLY